MNYLPEDEYWREEWVNQNYRHEFVEKPSNLFPLILIWFNQTNAIDYHLRWLIEIVSEERKT